MYKDMVPNLAATDKLNTTGGGVDEQCRRRELTRAGDVTVSDWGGKGVGGKGWNCTYKKL